MMDQTHDVIVIGGGPAGVAAAIELRKSGVSKVLLLERESELGGATRHCSHSPFGMLEFGRPYFGAAYGAKLRREADRHGVEIRTSHSVVKLRSDGALLVSTPQGLQNLTARRLVTATGARETPRSARLVSGDRPVGILTTGALQSYLAFYGKLPFKRPLVVGSELVSFSALLSCITNGIRPVAMLESKERITARKPFSLLASMLGVPIWTNAELFDIQGQGRVQSALVKQHGAPFEVECDGILFTGDFVPEASLLILSGLANSHLDGAPEIDQNGRLSNPIYFAAGNILRPIETGGWAYREGRSVARSVALDLLKSIQQGPRIKVQFEAPVKLVVPAAISPVESRKSTAFGHFQLRMQSQAHGCLKLIVDGQVRWQKSAHWLPERRILVPMPEYLPRAKHIAFEFERLG